MSDLHLVSVHAKDGIQLVVATKAGTIRHIPLTRKEATGLIVFLAKGLLRNETEETE